METSREEDRRKREDSGYNFVSGRCSLWEKLVKSILKCLGYDSPPTVRDQSLHSSPHQAQQGTNITEEDMSWAAVTLARRPPRPPISSGAGVSLRGNFKTEWQNIGATSLRSADTGSSLEKGNGNIISNSRRAEKKRRRRRKL
ncbi:uncharacterized protein LOC8274920 isoform X2 [Ricinus communis]|uniref:uncharacterized protein LOC8274920 isoform X2 n=1 Tax=Ricinus communis TaxID=3988 RepID=UPI00201AC30C|nr:uncharacterized protein LOC8274920 isoform X2 [Ricinus communis]